MVARRGTGEELKSLYYSLTYMNLHKLKTLIVATSPDNVMVVQSSLRMLICTVRALVLKRHRIQTPMELNYRTPNMAARFVTFGQFDLLRDLLR